MSPLRPFRQASFVTTILATLAIVVALAPAASAMPSSTPSSSTWGANGRVNAIVVIGDTIYIGGKFSKITEKGGAGPDDATRNNLAAFDADTGEPTDWNPGANGEVKALAASPDGDRVYAGGMFTTVDGSGRSKVAAIETDAAGTVESWKPPSINSSVWSIAASSTMVYLGGHFTTVGGSTRNGLAALSASTGARDSAWAPSANDDVGTVVLSPDGDTVFAGGEFDVVSGQSRKNAVALTAAGGDVVSGWRPNPGQRVFGISVQDDDVFMAIGGYMNEIANYDIDSGARKWKADTDGDVQAITSVGDVVYAGGHWNYFEGELRRKLVALDADTGALRSDWFPKLPSTGTTWYGIASLATDGHSRLLAGGDFDKINSVKKMKYAAWTGSIGGVSNDTEPPTKPGNLEAEAYGGSQINLDWSASSDDDAVAYYDVYRNGDKVDTAAEDEYTDTDVSPLRTYTYYVKAVDFAGNTSPASSSDSATTFPANEVKTFTAAEDSYVDSASSSSNFGSASTLKVLKPSRELLIKFNVSGVSGRQIVSAKLRLYGTDGSTSGGGNFHSVSSSWSESSVTWNNAPSASSTVVGKLDDVLTSKWYDVTLTSLVRSEGDGALSVLADSPSTNDAAYESTEGGSHDPELVVTLAAPGTILP